MPVTYDDAFDELVFSSGNRLYVNNNIVGIAHDLELFHGYDGTIFYPPPHWWKDAPDLSADYAEARAKFTDQDAHELADMMIERWRRFKALIGKQGDQADDQMPV